MTSRAAPQTAWVAIDKGGLILIETMSRTEEQAQIKALQQIGGISLPARWDRGWFAALVEALYAQYKVRIVQVELEVSE